MSRKGFTLIEVLVVIMIILIILGSVVGLFGLMFRASGLRSGGTTVSTVVTGAKTEASRTRQPHFVQLLQTGQMQVWRDMNPATPNLDTVADQKVGNPVDLPKGVAFGLLDDQAPGTASRYPDWIKVAPTGYIRYPAGYTYFQTVAFEQKFSGVPAPDGDIVIHVLGRPFRLYMDVDEVQGSIRKSHFMEN